MIAKLCALSIVLVAVVNSYPAEEVRPADLAIPKGVPAAVVKEEGVDQLGAVEEDENLKPAESAWLGGWGGRSWGYGGHGYGGYGRGWGGYGGYGGWGHGGYGGWGHGGYGGWRGGYWG